MKVLIIGHGSGREVKLELDHVPPLDSTVYYRKDGAVYMGIVANVVYDYAEDVPTRMTSTNDPTIYVYLRAEATVAAAGTSR